MSILSVNLKHLYQRRGLWLVYPLFGIVAFTVIKDPLEHPRAGEGEFIGFAVLPFFIGFLATLPQMEVLSKPLSYCLPGHRRVCRRYVFWTAITTSGVCSMLFLRYPDLAGGPLLLVVCSAFFAGLTFFMAGVLPAMVGMNAWIIFVIGPLTIIAGEHYHLNVVLERIIMGNVFPVVLVGILTSIAMWVWLGRAGLARRYCAAPWIGFIDTFNMEKLKRHTNARLGTKRGRFRKHPRPWVSKWFLGRMDKYDYRGPGRFFWGALYCTSALTVSRWQNILLFLPVFTIMFGYVGQATVAALVLVPAMLAMGRQPPVYSTMLISGGRRQRYTTTLWLAVTDAVLLCMGTLVISGLSILFARFMPTFSLEGHTLSFRPIDPRVAIVPLLFLPFASTMQLVFNRMPFLLFGALMLPLYVTMFLAFGWREHVKRLVTPVYVVSLLVASWGVFLLTLRHICSKWCLVGKRRMH
ncbi:MAG: hypothetical protein KAY65_08640 [Planctomycetes bacterium]|nr:hypothetical protein [Planctomycetota bacterium]